MYNQLGWIAKIYKFEEEDFLSFIKRDPLLKRNLVFENRMVLVSNWHSDQMVNAYIKYKKENNNGNRGSEKI